MGERDCEVPENRRKSVELRGCRKYDFELADTRATGIYYFSRKKKLQKLATQKENRECVYIPGGLFLGCSLWLRLAT